MAEFRRQVIEVVIEPVVPITARSVDIGNVVEPSKELFGLSVVEMGLPGRIVAADAVR